MKWQLVAIVLTVSVGLAGCERVTDDLAPGPACQINRCTRFDEFFIDNFTIEYDQNMWPTAMILLEDDQISGYKRVSFSYTRKGQLKSVVSTTLDPAEPAYNSTAKLEYDKKGRLIYTADTPNGNYVELELSYDSDGRIVQIKTLYRLYKVYYTGNDVRRVERVNTDTKKVVTITENVRMDASLSPFYRLPIAVKIYMMLQMGLLRDPSFSALLSEHSVAESKGYDGAGVLGVTTTNTYGIVDDKVVRVVANRAFADTNYSDYKVTTNLQYRCR